MITRRILAGAAGALLLASGASTLAQDYPVKPVTLIVPWPAGGSTDISMRAIAEVAARTSGPADRR